jgi:hypothetical protein
MTSPNSTTTAPREPKAPTPGLGLGPAQIAASALAAVTSALAASFLGVAGTIIGAAVGSVVATVGAAVYAHSLRTASSRLRELRPQAGGPASRRARPVSGPEHTPDVPSVQSRRPFGRLAAVVVGVFAVALAGITAAEAMMGHPLSSGNTAGTTLSRVVDGGANTPARHPDAVPGSTSTSEPSSSSSPTGTPATFAPGTGQASSPAPTGTATPSGGPTTQPPAGQPSARPSAAPSATPTAPAPTAPAPTSAPTVAPGSGATTAGP